MIYLSHYNTVAADSEVVLKDTKYPQRLKVVSGSYDRASSGFSYPPQAVVDQLLDEGFIAGMRERAAKDKTAFILAAGTQGWLVDSGKGLEDGPFHYELKLPGCQVLTPMYAGKLAVIMGITDHVSVDATACSSSIKVLMDATNLINNYGFKRVVVIGVEDSASNPVARFFGNAGAIIPYPDEGLPKPSAFDSVNRGFHAGQGAVLYVLETQDVLSYIPKAVLAGAYTAAEVHPNYLGQREDGQGFRRAIEGALQQAKLTPEDINIVKTHGTGTPSNNKAERNALEALLPSFVATAFKPDIGHTLAASGMLETGLLLNSIAEKGVVPRIANRTEKDDVFLSEDVSAPSGHILSLSAGMGNSYAAGIFQQV